MEKKVIVIVVLIFFAMLAIGYISISSNKYTSTRERTEDSFRLVFDNLNGEDSYIIKVDERLVDETHDPNLETSWQLEAGELEVATYTSEGNELFRVDASNPHCLGIGKAVPPGEYKICLYGKKAKGEIKSVVLPGWTYVEE